MAKSIRITQRHSDPIGQARQKIEAALAPHVTKFGLSQSWDQDCLSVAGKGVEGTLAVAENAIEIDLQLGFPASLVAGTIESELKQALDAAFTA